MKLYHYSSKKYDVLKTLAKQAPMSAKEIKKVQQESLEEYKRTKLMVPGYYYDHISFLFEPPPLSEMSSIFPPDHHTWRKGNSLYEYIVDSANIGQFNYHVKEMPEKTRLRYATKSYGDGTEYYRKLKALTLDGGYIGKGSDQLDKCSLKFLGTTQDMYRAIKTRPDYDNLKDKYAASVPHVALYPVSGLVAYESVRLVTCG